MIFISGLILSSTYFYENCSRAPLARAACANQHGCNLPFTPLHPPHYLVSDRSKRQPLYKKAHETLQQDIRKSPACKEEFFPPCHRYKQIDANADLKGRRLFKSLVTAKMKPITISGYAVPIQTCREPVLMGLKFYL